MELYDEYKQASQEVRQKLIDYLKAFKEKDKIKIVGMDYSLENLI